MMHITLTKITYFFTDDSDFRKSLLQGCKNASLCSPVSFSLWIICSLRRREGGEGEDGEGKGGGGDEVSDKLSGVQLPFEQFQTVHSEVLL